MKEMTGQDQMNIVRALVIKMHEGEKIDIEKEVINQLEGRKIDYDSDLIEELTDDVECKYQHEIDFMKMTGE